MEEKTKMLDQMTSMLFADYPREVGKKRTLCRTSHEFEQKIDLLNGVDECFTNVNPLNGSINKVFIDFDGQASLEEAQKLYTYMLSVGIPSIPIASGKKGVHLYALFKLYNGEDTKEVLYKTTKSLIIKTFGESYKSQSIDSHIIGDLRRLSRIPSTLRPPENCSFCTFLPPNKAFLEMKGADLKWYTKGVHIYPKDAYNFENGIPTFAEHILPQVQAIKVEFSETDSSQSPTCVDSEQLKTLLRPCLYRLITVAEPRHPVRLSATADLKRADFTTEEIVAMFRPLRWVDWSEEYTRYQISTTKPIYWDRQTMRRKGICFDKNCRRCS